MAFDVELAQRVAGFVILSLARGGFDPDRKYADDTERHKTEHGLAVWHAMPADKAQARLKDPLIRCECGEDVRGKIVHWKHCWLCKGKGRRVMTPKEASHLDWWLRQRKNEERTRQCGSECCADYVMDSTYRMAEFGYWNEPQVTDGWLVQHWTTKPKEPQVEIQFPVKVCDRVGNVVDVVTKPVVVSVPADQCREEWRTLRWVLTQRHRELGERLAAESDPFLRQQIQRDLWLIGKLQVKLTAKGRVRDDGAVRDVLTDEQFGQVAHLWRD